MTYGAVSDDSAVLVGAGAEREDLTPLLATKATAQADYDTKLALWVAAESPGSGAEFDAKVAAAAVLASADAAVEAQIEVAALACRDAVMTLCSDPSYQPATDAQRFADVAYVIAKTIVPGV